MGPDHRPSDNCVPGSSLRALIGRFPGRIIWSRINYRELLQTAASVKETAAMRKNGLIALSFHTLVILFVLAPLVIIVLVAFTPEQTLTLPTRGLSLRWFRAILDYPDFISAFLNSIKLALSSATLSLALALPAALAIGRERFPGREFLNGLFLSPLVIPSLVLGIAFLRFFAMIGATGSFPWLVARHIVILTPVV